MENNLYNNLGVDKNATPDEIKKAHRKGVKENHPDKGGDPEKFAMIQHAYEILSDEDRRKRYDETGDDEAPRDEFMMRFASFLEAEVLSILEKNKSFHIDIVEHGCRTLLKQITNSEFQIPQYQEHIAKLERAITRIKSKNGNTLMVTLIKEKIKLYNTKIDQLKQSIEFCNRAIDELMEYEFQIEEQSEEDKSNSIFTKWENL